MKNKVRLFKKVAIIGTGLIGGSVALALRKKKLAGEIIGVSRHKNTLIAAKRIGAIDRGSLDIKIVCDADLVILALPVGKIIAMAPQISRVIKNNCLVTDVGSTKEEIVTKLERVFPHYVGSHPLAGSEKRGIVHARADLFCGSPCLMCPTTKTSPAALKKIKKLWLALGARVIFIPADTHDKVLSFVSHLPHVAAFSLIKAVPGSYLKFSSGGLRDTTRIAASQGELWADIFLSNRKEVIKAIGVFTKQLAQIKSAIRKRDKRLLNKILTQARKKRERLI